MIHIHGNFSSKFPSNSLRKQVKNAPHNPLSKCKPVLLWINNHHLIKIGYTAYYDEQTNYIIFKGTNIIQHKQLNPYISITNPSSLYIPKPRFVLPFFQYYLQKQTHHRIPPHPLASWKTGSCTKKFKTREPYHQTSKIRVMHGLGRGMHVIHVLLERSLIYSCMKNPNEGVMSGTLQPNYAERRGMTLHLNV